VAIAGDEGGQDELLTTAQAAKVMGVTDAHVRRVIGTGELKATRFGGHSWVIRRADAEAWAKVQRRTGPKGKAGEDRSTWITLTLEAHEVRQWRDLGERAHPTIPAHALRLANQMLDNGVAGVPFDAGPSCDVMIDLDTQQVRFRLSNEERPGRRSLLIDL
jgi:excisionase family DNA binding protein